MAVVTKTTEKLGITLTEALHSFGRFCFPKFAKKYPNLVTPYKNPKEFLKSVHSMVHIEVKKLYRDAEPPDFFYKEPADNRLIIEYSSKRKLCHFMEGLIDGVADYFKSPIKYKQTSCTLNGNKTCEFDLTFS